ncbi:hypothetical protein DUI87_17962 [Hirundo rustica rustica]|uniref:Uncharacterized protein n=1 Tax=Hirundo rustica rustica TaxID=333673 RepID=A0A3M0K0P3_HIRRU|nr:hypothetical protein DUI87_17962 [Hirundo rustica rustica]
MADRSLESVSLPLEVRARLAELELELSEGGGLALADLQSAFLCILIRWVMVPLMSGFTNKKLNPKETRKEEKEENTVEEEIS